MGTLRSVLQLQEFLRGKDREMSSAFYFVVLGYFGYTQRVVVVEECI